MGDGLATQEFEGGVVVHILVFYDTTMAVRSIFAHADIGYDHEVRVFVLYGLYGLLHRAVGVKGAGAFLILVLGYAEEDYGRYAEGLYLAGFLFQVVHRELELPGHGLYLVLYILAARHEQGEDEIRARQVVLPHHPSYRLVRTEPSRSVNRKTLLL